MYPAARGILVAAIVLLSACSDGGAATTTSSSAASGTTSPALTTTSLVTAPESTSSTTTTRAPVIPAVLEGFDIERISIDGTVLLVAVADTGDLRRQGLMNVESLGDLDGMLFVFEQDTPGGFWMKDTLIPLDIAFFAADGSFVDGFEMQPCTTDECPTYTPNGVYRYALELPLGAMPDEVLNLDSGR